MKTNKYADIKVGGVYIFFCEMQEEYHLASDRLRNYTGQAVTVIAETEGHEIWGVRAVDGKEFPARTEELNGWDFELGQYFWPDGTYGPNHDTQFQTEEDKLRQQP